LVKNILEEVSSKSVFTFVNIISKSIMKIQDRILVSCITLVDGFSGVGLRSLGL